MIKRAGFAVLALLFCVALAGAAPEDARFSGGSYDGWSCCVMTESAGLGGAVVTLSSGEDQLFDFTATPPLANVSIVAEDPKGAITVGNYMHLSVPATWACSFDPSAQAVFSGNAASKVGTPTYINNGRTLKIPITSNFVENDTLIVAGLKLFDLRLVSPGSNQLELDIDGDGERDVSDTYSLQVRALWPGGSYDGCASCTMAKSQAFTLSGTMFMFR